MQEFYHSSLKLISSEGQYFQWFGAEIVFGLVESVAFNGGFKKNPYSFQHFNMASLGIAVNGEAIPFKPIQLSFGANARFIGAFCAQFSGTGKMYYNTGNGISHLI